MMVRRSTERGESGMESEVKMREEKRKGEMRREVRRMSPSGRYESRIVKRNS